MLSVVLLCLTVPMVLVVVAMQGTHCARITHSLSLDLPDSPQPSPPSSLGVIFEVIFPHKVLLDACHKCSARLSPSDVAVKSLLQQFPTVFNVVGDTFHCQGSFRQLQRRPSPVISQLLSASS